MASRMDEFRDFVRRYPGIRQEVANNTSSWQKIYEDWVILGENDERFSKYKQTFSNDNNSKKGMFEDLFQKGNMKNVVDYVKKINPDSISKTLNTVQKVLQITQSFGGKNVSSLYNANYNSWWD